MGWNDLRKVPLSRFILGVVAGWALSIGVCVWLWTVPAFEELARIDVTGQVTDVRVPSVMDQPVLDFALQGQHARFRVQSGVFAEALGGQVPKALELGATVRLTVAKSDYDNPFAPAPYRVPTVTAEAIQIGETPVLLLETSREWSNQNRRLAVILAPIFFVLAAFITALFVVRLRQGL